MSVVKILEGSAGRFARIVVGLALIGLGLGLGGWWFVLAAIGVLPLVTGTVGVCLVSSLVQLRGRGARPA